MAYHVGRDEFDRLVEEALRSVPRRYRAYFRNVAISVEDYPADEAVPLGIRKNELLGLFRGSSYPEQRGFFDIAAPMPESITIYQKNIEAISDSRDRLLEEIRLTLLHEIGHYFGLSEDDLSQYE